LVSTSANYVYNALEIAAAKANDAAYLNLLALCGAQGAGCTGRTANLFIHLSELEYNAEELLGFGQYQGSLKLSAQGFGFALRWTADEEYSAQSSLTTRVANNQLAAVSNRLTTLRFLSQTVRLAAQDRFGGDDRLAGRKSTDAFGGAASADGGGSRLSRWSVYANGSYGDGTKQPTDFDDAFGFDGTQYNAGADMRLDARTVLGFMFGYVSQKATFDSNLSIVSGGIKAKGPGVTLYLQKEWNAAYGNVSLGYQRTTLDTIRIVAYPSNNPSIPSVNGRFSSSTTATAWNLAFGAGYVFHAKGFSAEPYLRGQYMLTKIGAFSEAADVGYGDTAFAVDAGSQSVTSAIGTGGAKFQYAFLPAWGVVVPYLYGEYRREFKNPSQAINSTYLYGTGSGGDFALPTESIKPDYYQVGAGFSAVLPHGIQLYAQYMKVLQLQNYSDYVASGGIRVEL
jgi:uncharacterized protein with beta-barrel porin domain